VQEKLKGQQTGNREEKGKGIGICHRKKADNALRMVGKKGKQKRYVEYTTQIREGDLEPSKKYKKKKPREANATKR